MSVWNQCLISDAMYIFQVAILKLGCLADVQLLCNISIKPIVILTSASSPFK